VDFLAFLLYLVALYIRPQDWMPLFLNRPVDIVLFSVILVISFITRKLKIQLLGFSLVFLAWVVWIFLGDLIKVDLDKAVTWGYVYLRYFIIFLCAMAVMTTVKRVRVVMWSMVVLAALLGLQNIYQVYHGVGWAGQPLGWEDSMTRAAGELGRARWVGLWDGMNVLCLLFVTTLPLVIGFWSNARSTLERVAALGTGSLIIIGALLTKSRGGLLAMLIIVSLYYFQRLKSIKAIAILGVLFFLFLLVAPARMFNYDDKEHSASYRVEMWEKGYDMFRWNYVMGVGRGEFLHHSYRKIAHNSFVQILAETGAVGLFLWSTLLYMTFQGLYQVRRDTQDTRLRDMAHTMLLVLTGYVITSFFITAEFELLYLFIAIACTLMCVAGVRPSLAPKDLRNILAVDMALGMGFFIITRIYWKLF
jgi:putative inorganic carbon (HCO3(-)) transporter